MDGQDNAQPIPNAVQPPLPVTTPEPPSAPSAAVPHPPLPPVSPGYSKDALNPRQERFCQLYASDREFFGNGVESYLEVYDIDRSKPNWYRAACSAASRLLSDVKICTRINELMEDGGLSDVYVDKQMLFLITQHADFGAKLGAIREYNKLKKRITEKLDVTTGGQALPTPIYGGKSSNETV